MEGSPLACCMRKMVDMPFFFNLLHWNLLKNKWSFFQKETDVGLSSVNQHTPSLCNVAGKSLHIKASLRACNMSSLLKSIECSTWSPIVLSYFGSSGYLNSLLWGHSLPHPIKVDVQGYNL